MVNLNRFQRSGAFHPFTCGGDRNDAAHVAYALKHDDNDSGLLVATTAGWHCPVCGYKQTWAHSVMASAEALRRQQAVIAQVVCEQQQGSE